MNEFQAAQDSIIEASQAAAQSAKENMQNVYAKATKISLLVSLKAPDIIIPADSKNYDAVLLDLGHISISNHFSTMDIFNENQFPAVVDEMRIVLSDLKLARIKLNEQLEMERELRLLEPMTFRINVKRNLSASWYRSIPDVDISGKIDTIEVL